MALLLPRVGRCIARAGHDSRPRTAVVRKPFAAHRPLAVPIPIQLQQYAARRWLSATPLLYKKQEPEGTPTVTADDAAKRYPPRKSPGKSSLRRVALEAERSRVNFIRQRGKARFVDPDAETKTVTAYCAAEQYNISTVARLIQHEGYILDPLKSGLYPQVVHTQVVGRADGREQQETGDIFIFPSGTLVTWNVPERTAMHFVNKILLPAAKGSHPDVLETEDLGYIEDPTRETSQILGDTIILGTKGDNQSSDEGNTPSEQQQDRQSLHEEADTILAKIAFSSGLARSTKLAVLESLLASYFDSTRSIPTLLAKGTKMPFSRPFILRKTGELLSLRAQLNLYSELTDSLPDLFWESRHELGLEGYYDEVGKALDVNVRIKALNEKMDYAQDIASVLREWLSEKHGLLLEWLIIALISIEVGFELLRIWKERSDAQDPNTTEALMRRYLEKELEKQRR